LILYTSGTTGAPKGAMISHANILANCVMGKAWVPGLGDKPERFLAALPFFHVYGMTTVVALGVYVGAEIILLPAPQRPSDLGVRHRQRRTGGPAVATPEENALAPAAERGGARRRRPAAYPVAGGAALPVRSVGRWEAVSRGRR